jgi:hypothetical protein
VSDYSGLFLGMMAVSLVVMAAVQIGLIIVAIRVGRQLTATTSQIQQEIRPLVEEARLVTHKAGALTDEATRVLTLANLQVQRVDQFMATTTTQLDRTLGVIQNVVGGPVGRGMAAITAFRAAMSVVRDWRVRRRRHSHDEEDALFVG